MKRLLIMLASCLSLNAFSQTNTFPANGNVGIGTTSPSFKLQIQKTSASNPALMIGGAYSGGPRIQAYGLDANSNAWMGLGTDMGIGNYEHSIYFPSYANLGKLSFGSYDGSNYYTKMIIHENGNVGIGTTSPGQLLTVGRNQNGYTYIASDNAYIPGAGVGSGFAITEGNNITWFLRGERDNSGKFNIGNPSGNKLTIDSYGNVGIGTTSPGQLLTVGRNQNGYTYIASDNTYTPGAGVGSGFAITENNSIAWFLRGERDNSGKFNIGNPSGNKFTIDSYGNVGIGTTNPTTKLAVNGTIKAKEIKVTLDGWSDFVFHPTYKLRTLGEVEQFIKTNNHLPEIPTEVEVKENGVSLGEMNAKLLQKIEELTLYLIEQKKENEKQNEKQNQLIKELEQKIESISNKK